MESIRTFIDIDDAMEAYWLAAKRGKIKEIYNIGGDKIISVKNFLKEFRKHTRWKPKIKFNESVIKLLEECKKLKDTGY